MNNLKKTIPAILLATVWISISEFVRNEFLLKSFWTSHYNELGLDFPAEPVNGIVWGIWSLCFAVAIFLISRRFTTGETALIAWFVGFVLMWIVLWNMDVLPSGILLIAVPLSLLEAFVATLIIKRMTKTVPAP